MREQGKLQKHASCNDFGVSPMSGKYAREILIATILLEVLIFFCFNLFDVHRYFTIQKPKSNGIYESDTMKFDCNCKWMQFYELFFSQFLRILCCKWQQTKKKYEIQRSIDKSDSELNSIFPQISRIRDEMIGIEKML